MQVVCHEVIAARTGQRSQLDVHSPTQVLQAKTRRQIFMGLDWGALLGGQH